MKKDFKKLGDELILNGKLSSSELKKTIYDLFKKNWVVSKEDFSEVRFINYSNLRYCPKCSNIDIDLEKLQHYIIYVNYLNIFSTDSDENDENLFLPREYIEYDKKGGACIYSSVLLYCMLYFNKVCSKEDMAYIQGYYKYNMNQGIFSLISNEIDKIGLHSFMRIGTAIIDTSIVVQNIDTFDFEGKFLIFGDVPKGITLVGYEETFETVMKYANIFKDLNGFKSIEEWVEAHTKNSIDLSFNLKEIIENED